MRGLDDWILNNPILEFAQHNADLLERIGTFIPLINNPMLEFSQHNADLLERMGTAIPIINNPMLEFAQHNADLLERMGTAIPIINNPMLEFAQHNADLLERIGTAIPIIKNPMIEFSQHYADMLGQIGTAIPLSFMESSSILNNLGQFQGIFENLSAVSRAEQISEFNCTLSMLSQLGDAVDFGDELDNLDEDAVSEDDKLAFSADLAGISIKSKNWQQDFYHVVIRWRDKNPILAWILDKILFAIFIGIIINVLSSGFTANTGAVTNTVARMEPSTAAQVVCNIAANQSVQVVDDCPYWYQIEIYDEVHNQLITGWVSKRSLVVMDSGVQENTK